MTQSVDFRYTIPRHLEGIFDVDQLREADYQQLDRELRAQGSSIDAKVEEGVIWRMGFPNMILDVRNASQESKSTRLNVVPIHPHRADLAFKRDQTLPRNVSPLTVACVLQDTVGKYVLGVRGGDVARGKIALMPGGHAEYLPIKSPLHPDKGMEMEFEEEIGYPLGPKDSINLIGVHPNADTNGLNVLYHIASQFGFDNLSVKWTSARDRHEHQGLFAVDQDHIANLAQTSQTSIGSETYETTPFFADCMQMYLDKVAE